MCRNTSWRIAYVLGVFLCFVASIAAAVDSETWHYGLDNVGNITSRGTDSQNPTHNYGYDGVYRLTNETNPSNTDQYSYDSNSNRTSFTRDGSSTSYQIDSNSNRLTQVGSDPHTYDSIGNTKTDRNGTRIFTYNQAGRLTQVHENSLLMATYTYNAYGQRTIKTTPSGSTYYLYDDYGQLIGEYDETGQPIKEYVHLEDEPIAQLESSNITYLHSDHLATPRKATNETGDVVWKWDSEAFGNKPPESGGPTVNLRFPGQYYDSETGIYYNYFRTYDPSTGRYIQSDPLGLYDGPNTYTYVYGNPLSYSDPTGEFVHIGVGVIIGGISGLIAGLNDPCATASSIFTSTVVGGLVGGVSAAVPIAGTALSSVTRGQAIARGAAAGFFGNSAGQIATGGFANYSPVQAATQGAVGAASGGLGHAAGFASAMSSLRLTGNVARALRLGAGTGTTVATATGATANLGLPSNVGGLNGSNSSCGCTEP